MHWHGRRLGQAVEQPPTPVSQSPIRPTCAASRLRTLYTRVHFACPRPIRTVTASRSAAGRRAYNPVRNSLFVGTRSARVAEVTVPDPVKAATISGLPVAEYLQPFADPAEGRIKDSRQGRRRHCLACWSTPANWSAPGRFITTPAIRRRVSHFSRPLIADGPRRRRVMRASGTSGKTGFVAGYMAAVPPEWQSSLGGPAITGQCCVPIVSRTSWGPAAFAFDPGRRAVAARRRGAAAAVLHEAITRRSARGKARIPLTARTIRWAASR